MTPPLVRGFTSSWMLLVASALAAPALASGLPDVPGRDEMEAEAARQGVVLEVKTRAAAFSQTAAELGSLSSEHGESRYCGLHLPSRERLQVDPNLALYRHQAPETWTALAPRLQLALIQHEVAHCLDAGFFDRGVDYTDREAFADGVVVLLALRDGAHDFAHAFASFRGADGHGPHAGLGTGALLGALIEAERRGQLAESFARVTKTAWPSAQFADVLAFMHVVRSDERWRGLARQPHQAARAVVPEPHP